ncbi:MAG: hypothetical protein NPIRA05_00240 [Nitrospirales bacterium]|nr:MAG: hypothetical protein NPIRA05_00240 [Nitrospirales bacterium]
MPETSIAGVHVQSSQPDQQCVITNFKHGKLRESAIGALQRTGEHKHTRYTLNIHTVSGSTRETNQS